MSILLVRVLISLCASISYSLGQQCMVDIAALMSPCVNARDNCVNDVSNRFANFVGADAHLQNSIGPFVDAIKLCGDAHVVCLRALQTTPECVLRLRESVESRIHQMYQNIVGVAISAGPCCSSNSDGSPLFAPFAGGFEFDSSSCCTNPMGGDYRCCRGALLLPPEPIVWPNADGSCSETAKLKCGATIDQCLQAAYDPRFPGSVASQCNYCFAQVCQCAARFNCTAYAEQVLSFHTVDVSGVRTGYRLCPRPMPSMSVCGVPTTTAATTTTITTFPPTTTACAVPPPHDCSYYTNCLQPLTGPQCTIVPSIMAAKCRDYVDLEPSLSSEGQLWSAYVRPCLVKKIIVSLDANVPDKCARATDVFFNQHLECYVDGPLSFCDLALSDQASIIGVASTIIFTPYAVDAGKSGGELLATCVGRSTRDAANKLYFRLQMKLRSVLRKRMDVDVNAALLDARNALEAVVEDLPNVTLAFVTIETNRTNLLAIVMAQIPKNLANVVAGNLSAAMSMWRLDNNWTLDASFERVVAVAEPTQTQTDTISMSVSVSEPTTASVASSSSMVTTDTTQTSGGRRPASAVVLLVLFCVLSWHLCCHIEESKRHC